MFHNALRAAALAAALAALAACGAVPRSGADVHKTINPVTPPRQNVTDFTDGLACMDELLLRFGVFDVSVLLEELQDRTQKLNAGTRDMLVSAVSDMTRRSRAIRLVTFGSDTSNAVGLQGQLEQRVTSALPKYDIRGSITQFDEDVARDQADVGLPKLVLPTVPSVVLSSNRSRQFGAIALDLSVIHTADLTLVPGVASKNLVVFARDTATNQASAAIEKIGISFNFTYGRSEGPAQALRSMVELATIELFGKLLRLPYWECLRIAPGNARVQKEIDDWFFAMDRNRELVGFFQEQLRNRGFYSGPGDGVASPELDQALAAFRRRAGIALAGGLDRAAFEALLLQPSGPAPAPLAAAGATPREPTGLAPAADISSLPAAAASSAVAPTARPLPPIARAASVAPPVPSALAARPVATIATGAPAPAPALPPARATTSSLAPRVGHPAPVPAPTAGQPVLPGAVAGAATAALGPSGTAQTVGGGAAVGTLAASALSAAALPPGHDAPPKSKPAASGPDAPGRRERAPVPLIRLSKAAYRTGDDVSFEVLAAPDSHLYCYHEDNNGRVARIYPNRFAPDARVRTALPIVFPGTMRFALQAEGAGPEERIGCLATVQDVFGSLPASLRIADFEPIAAARLEEVAAWFARATGGHVPLTAATIEIERAPGNAATPLRGAR